VANHFRCALINAYSQRPGMFKVPPLQNLPQAGLAASHEERPDMLQQGTAAVDAVGSGIKNKRWPYCGRHRARTHFFGTIDHLVT